MARATARKRDPEPDRGPDPLTDVKHVDLRLTPNETRALLILADRVEQNSQSGNTLAGEISTIEESIYQALDRYAPDGVVDPSRFIDRDDIAVGSVKFLKGGRHV